jgi:hypothetical protein
MRPSSDGWLKLLQPPVHLVNASYPVITAALVVIIIGVVAFAVAPQSELLRSWFGEGAAAQQRAKVACDGVEWPRGGGKRIAIRAAFGDEKYVRQCRRNQITCGRATQACNARRAALSETRAE